MGNHRIFVFGGVDRGFGLAPKLSPIIVVNWLDCRDIEAGKLIGAFAEFG